MPRRTGRPCRDSNYLVLFQRRRFQPPTDSLWTQPCVGDLHTGLDHEYCRQDRGIPRELDARFERTPGSDSAIDRVVITHGKGDGGNRALLTDNLPLDPMRLPSSGDFRKSRTVGRPVIPTTHFAQGAFTRPLPPHADNRPAALGRCFEAQRARQVRTNRPALLVAVSSRRGVLSAPIARQP